MADTNRGLLRWFASKHPIWSALKVTPFIVFYSFVFWHQGIKWTNLLWFLAGILVWSLFEYIVHRWVYHIPIRNKKMRWYIDAFHDHHHRNLEDYEVLNAGFLLSYPITLIILSIVYLITFDLRTTASFGMGMTLYYIFYEFIHYLIHYKHWKSGYMQFIQKYHLFHHYQHWQRNFGNTLTIWDHVFGTYDDRYKSFTITNDMKSAFIQGSEQFK